MGEINLMLKGVVIGGTTIDLINGSWRVGGSAYYATKALEIFGLPLMIITNSLILKPYIRSAGNIIAREGTPIIYRLENVRGSRRLTLLRTSKVMIPNNLENLLEGTEYFVIISPVADEVDINTLFSLRRVFQGARAIGVDLQGFTRIRNDEGLVMNDPNKAVPVIRALDSVDTPTIFKAERGEVQGTDLSQILNGSGNKYLVVTNRSETIDVIAHGKLCRIDPLPGIYGDETGAGDVFLSVSTYALSRGMEIRSSIAEGIIAGGLKVLRVHPPWFTQNEIYVLEGKVKESWRCRC
ncbi:MAG: hypothetical protein J7L55_05315 [Desulfurococcales archaeon]|nr:hypothetical protein [Desulfurococcales archaeon]